MQPPPIAPSSARQQSQELNLCAISTLLSEARRIDANIRPQAGHAEPFWKLMPDVVIRPQYAYYKGFGKYNPKINDTHHPYPLLEWHFELDEFPRFVTRMAGRAGIMPLFYEEVHPRKKEHGRMMQARAFSVFEDTPIDVATVYKRAGGEPEYRFNPEIELFKLQSNNHFTFVLNKVDFLPASYRVT